MEELPVAFLLVFAFSGLFFAAGVEIQRGILVNRIALNSGLTETIDWGNFAWASMMVFLGFVVVYNVRYKPLEKRYSGNKRKWTELVEDF